MNRAEEMQERAERHEALLDRAPRDERERLHDKLHMMAEQEIEQDRRSGDTIGGRVEGGEFL
jgi:hypothetical protein